MVLFRQCLHLKTSHFETWLSARFAAAGTFNCSPSGKAGKVPTPYPRPWFHVPPLLNLATRTARDNIWPCSAARTRRRGARSLAGHRLSRPAQVYNHFRPRRGRSSWPTRPSVCPEACSRRDRKPGKSRVFTRISRTRRLAIDERDANGD